MSPVNVLGTTVLSVAGLKAPNIESASVRLTSAIGATAAVSAAALAPTPAAACSLTIGCDISGSWRFAWLWQSAAMLLAVR